jgi:hypothetical protein
MSLQQSNPLYQVLWLLNMDFYNNLQLIYILGWLYTIINIATFDPKYVQEHVISTSL